MVVSSFLHIAFLLCTSAVLLSNTGTCTFAAFHTDQLLYLSVVHFYFLCHLCLFLNFLPYQKGLHLAMSCISIAFLLLTVSFTHYSVSESVFLQNQFLFLFLVGHVMWCLYLGSSRLWFALLKSEFGCCCFLSEVNGGKLPQRIENLALVKYASRLGRHIFIGLS